MGLKAITFSPNRVGLLVGMIQLPLRAIPAAPVVAVACADRERAMAGQVPAAATAAAVVHAECRNVRRFIDRRHLLPCAASS